MQSTKQFDSEGSSNYCDWGVMVVFISSWWCWVCCLWQWLLVTHRGRPAAALWCCCLSRWQRSSGKSLSLTGWQLWSGVRWHVDSHGNQTGCVTCGTHWDTAGHRRTTNRYDMTQIHCYSGILLQILNWAHTFPQCFNIKKWTHTFTSNQTLKCSKYFEKS